MRIDRVYTRGGDDGTTALIGGDRVAKSSARIDGYGTVDELNAVLGLACEALDGSPAGPRLDPLLRRIQNELFDLGCGLATPDAARRATMPHVQARHVEALEREIDELNEGLPTLRSFVLPGGGAASAHLHLARTVCRRAERIVVGLREAGEDVGEHAIAYLNRLSDALFVFGRWAAHQEGKPEPVWRPGE